MSAVKKVTKKKVTKRASFNPIAMCASISNGKCRITKKTLKPPKREKTIEQIKKNLKAEDINYVFVYVLNFWSSDNHQLKGTANSAFISGMRVSHNMKKYADKKQIRANGNTLTKDRFAGRKIYRATHGDLLVLCQKLLTQLSAGRMVTLKSTVAQLNVYPQRIDGKVNIKDVKDLIEYLKNWLLNNQKVKDSVLKDSVCPEMCVIGYMPQFRTFTLK